MADQNQVLAQQQKASLAPQLAESRESKFKLDNLLLGCFASQKLYGRDTGNAEAITDMFHSMLGKYPADKVILAFQTWLERSQEFPTPADIIGLIRRNGRPPLSQAEIIAIRRKDGTDRTPEDWQALRDWEADRDQGWDDETDQTKHNVLLAENVRLRSEVHDLRAEVRRLGELLHESRRAQGLDKPNPDIEARVRNTIAEMRKSGASQLDIDEFARQYDMTDAA